MIIIVSLFILLITFIIYVTTKSYSVSSVLTTQISELKEVDDILNQMGVIFDEVKKIDVKQFNEEEHIAYQDLMTNTFNVLREHSGYKSVTGILAYRYTLDWMRDKFYQMNPSNRSSKRSLIIDNILN